MQDQQPQTAENNSPQSQASHHEHWLEQAVAAAIAHVESFLKTFLTLLWQPNTAAQIAAGREARPRSFLIGALLVSGLMIEIALLYRGRSIDNDVLNACTRAIESWGLRELFLLTIPPLAVVWLTACLVGWLAGAGRLRGAATLFNGLCHSVGVQLLIVALAALTFIGLKALQANSAEDHRWTRDFVLAPVLIAIVLTGTLQLQALLAIWGQADWTRRWWLRLPFATIVSAGCILGVIRIAAETFDFRDSQQIGRRLSMEEWSAKARVLVDVLESRAVSETPSDFAPGQTQVEQRIALTNVTSLPHAIACPSELRLLGDHSARLVSVTCLSGDRNEMAGWVLQPGETRIVAWTLTLPNDVLRSDVTIAAFSCVEIDLQRWHREIERPLGPPIDCFVCLRPADWSVPEARLASQPSTITNSKNSVDGL